MNIWLLYVQLAVVLPCATEMVLYSGYGTVVVRGDSTTPAVWTSDQWAFLPPAVFVWESNSWSGGTYTFQHTFVLPTWRLSRITKGTLWIVVDDTYSAWINGHFIGSGPYFVTGVFDIPASWLVGADSTEYRENKLVMDVYNGGWYGGVQYILSITYT